MLSSGSSLVRKTIIGDPASLQRAPLSRRRVTSRVLQVSIPAESWKDALSETTDGSILPVEVHRCAQILCTAPVRNVEALDERDLDAVIQVDKVSTHFFCSNKQVFLSL